MPADLTLRAISGFRLVVSDLERLGAFYRALGFVADAPQPITPDELRVVGLAGSGWRMSLSLGRSRVDLDQYDAPGRRYPEDASAADLVFQHFALVADDAAAAWALASSAGAAPISRDGPVTLPQSSGGVRAVKFRDPDGHPLEFLQFPAGANPAWQGHGIQGIDHSAICVSDVAASRSFYAKAGLAEGDATLNEGPTQVALDGLDDVRVEVVPMNPSAKPPHVELLGYRHPLTREHAPLAANDIAATRIVWTAGQEALVRDPDGHLLQLVRGDR